MDDNAAKKPPDRPPDWGNDGGMLVDVESDYEDNLALSSLRERRLSGSVAHSGNRVSQAGKIVKPSNLKSKLDIKVLDNTLLNPGVVSNSPAFINSNITQQNNEAATNFNEVATGSGDNKDEKDIGTAGSGDKPKSGDSFYDFDNRYRKSDRGPYYVYIEHRDKNIGRLFPVRLGHYLFKDELFKNNVIDITSIGINRVKVIFKSYLVANQLVSSEIIKENNLVAYIPRFFTHKKGVIKMVDTYFSEEFLKTAIESDFKVVEVKRMKRKRVNENGETDLIPRQMIIVTFLGNTLPENVKINLVNFPVEPYIHPVVQCFSCLRFGHTSNMCKGSVRCKRCGGAHQLIHCDSSETTCVYCKSSEHVATSKDCPEYIKQFNIKRAMAAENVSFKEAERLVNNPSYAKVTRNNRFAVLADLENFPNLPSPKQDASRTNLINPGVRRLVPQSFPKKRKSSNDQGAPVLQEIKSQGAIPKTNSAHGRDKKISYRNEGGDVNSFSQPIIPNPHREEFILYKEKIIEQISTLFKGIIESILPGQSNINLDTQYNIKEHLFSIFNSLNQISSQ